MKNHYNLNFKFPILKTGFEFPKPKTQVWDIFILKPKEFASTQAIAFFHNLGLTLYNCHIFRGAPGKACGIHVDGHTLRKESQSVWAINWILEAEESSMHWYNPIGEGNKMINHAGTPYQRWNLDQVEEIERASFSGPTLVRTDIPHRVVNYDVKNPRWCISIRSTKTLINSWEDSVNFFKPYINDQT
jgi:hypothetical protein